MFKNKGKKTSAPSAQDVTVINKGATIEGEVKVSGTIRIYGQLNGTLRSEGKVIIAEQGALNGDLYADAADVSGRVEGAIEADRLDLRSTAQVEGNVVVKKFTTETGAIFVGDCKMPQNGALPSGTPSPNEADEESSDEPSDEPADALPEDEQDDASMEDEPLAKEEAAEPEDAKDVADSEPDGAPQAEPVATPVGKSIDDGGVKPLPNKPNGETGAEEAAEDKEEASADAQEARPRFW